MSNFPSSSATSDSLLLEDLQKKKKQRQKDEKVLEKVEWLDDKKDTLSSKEQAEIDRIEATKSYLRQQLTLIEDKHQKQVLYYNEQLATCERRQDEIRNRYSSMIGRAEIKQSRLINQIQTPSVKKQFQEIVQPPNPENKISDPPLAGGQKNLKIKMAAKQPGVKVVKVVPKETAIEDLPQEEKEQMGRQMLLDAKEQEYLTKKAAFDLLERKMMEKNALLKRAKAELEDLNRKLPLPDEDIFQKENEIAVLKQEINLLYEQMPKEFRK